MSDTFMTEHPLREKLKQKDWERIQKAVDADDYSDVSTDEILAYNDAVLDQISAKAQTHISVFLLH